MRRDGLIADYDRGLSPSEASAPPQFVLHSTHGRDPFKNDTAVAVRQHHSHGRVPRRYAAERARELVAR